MWVSRLIKAPSDLPTSDQLADPQSVRCQMKTEASIEDIEIAECRLYEDELKSSKSLGDTSVKIQQNRIQTEKIQFIKTLRTKTY